jgi:ABC-type antimicrobial peptide transport system permease subunit
MLSLKATLYRSPLKAVLTFVLLAAVSFAVYSQAAEYVVSAREMDRAARQYAGIGAAEIAPPPDRTTRKPLYERVQNGQLVEPERYEPLTRGQIEAIAELPYITSSDERYMTAGVSDVYYRPDDGGFSYNYTARCVIEGTLEAIIYGEPPEAGGNILNENLNHLVLEDCRLVAGNDPRIVSGEVLGVLVDPQTYDGDSITRGGLSVARTAVVHNASYIYGADYIGSLKLGTRYAFVVRFEPINREVAGVVIEQRGYFLSDHLAELWCGAVWPLDGAPDNYLETEEFAPLRELAVITNADARTFDMVYTEDMSAIMRFADGRMALTEGRKLTPEDSAADLRVCVISRQFAEENGLTIGDTLNFKLGERLFEQYKGFGAVAATKERYEPAKVDVTLEIVGIYIDVDSPEAQSREPHWGYSVSTVFVPKSLLPVDEAVLEGHEFAPGEFSFKIADAWDIPAFLEESAPVLEEMGLTLIFHDGGWPAMSAGFLAAQKLSMIKLAALTASSVAATVFVVYLFIGRRKKEYAVMRALGTPRGASARSLLIPLLALAMVSVLAGCAAAWAYTAKTIVKSSVLSALEKLGADASVPAPVAICCIAGELLLALLFALLLLRRIGALPPLALLQDGEGRQKRARLSENNKNRIGRRDSRRGRTCPSRCPFVLRYIWKHACRSAGKSALAVALAALFFVAICQFALMRQSYAELRDGTVVTANFTGGLPLDYVASIIESGYVKEPYYGGRTGAGVDYDYADIVVTNDIARYTGEEAEITYAQGYDETCMGAFGEILILGETLMAAHGIELGDTVDVVPVSYTERALQKYIQYHKTNYPDDKLTDDKLMELYGDKVREETAPMAVPYTVAGVIRSSSAVLGGTAFAPGVANEMKSLGALTRLDVAEFTLADNTRADEFRDYSERLAYFSLADSVDFIMDTSKLDNILNTTKLLGSLYPIAVAAALLIGGFLCALVIFQSSKDAAIMRVQGTTRRKAGAMLALEQALLSAAGLALGVCGLAAYNGTGMAAAAEELVPFAALYFAAIVAAAVASSAAATRKNVLELLQTRE